MTKPIARDPIYHRRVFDAEFIELVTRNNGMDACLWRIAVRQRPAAGRDLDSDVAIGVDLITV
jgi:hypothetical protein